MALTHPWGLLALLAIPAILALHLLRHRRRRFVVPALFLIPHQAPSSLAGARIESFRRSLPLWLQLLAALLFTWLLVGPRWDSSREIPRVVVVLDSSASMQASIKQVREKLPEQLFTIEGKTPEIILLSADLSEGQLYRGNDRAEFSSTLNKWQPWGASPDLGAALEVGRALAGAEGALLLVSDHIPPGPLPAEAQLVSWGEAKANVGFVGIQVFPAEGNSPARWEALVRNNSTTAQARTWQIVGQGDSLGQLTLDPGSLQVIDGPLPAGERLQLELEADAFPADDRLLVFAPQPKPLIVSLDPQTPAWISRLLQLLPAIQLSEEPAAADLLIYPFGSEPIAAPDQAQLRFATGGTLAPEAAVEGLPVDLAEGLDFGPLLPLLPAESSPAGTEPKANARSLAWSGDLALITLETGRYAPALSLRFDPAAGNAARVPALAVLIARFVESLRAPLPRSSDELRGGGEQLLHPPPGPLSWRFEPLDPQQQIQERQIPAEALFRGLQLPRLPGLLTLSSAAEDPDQLPIIYRAAIHFAEFSEADLANLAPAPFPEFRPASHAEPERRDPAARWILASLALLLPLCWWFDRPSA